MKVHYKRRITDQISELKYQAAKDNKTISYISITDEEARQLYREVGCMLSAGRWTDFHRSILQGTAKIFGTRLEYGS